MRDRRTMTMTGVRSLSEMSVKDRVKKRVLERRRRLSENKINSIPSPFERFRSEFLGIEQGKMYLTSSFTKGAKTQFTTFMFVLNVLLYAYRNPDRIRVRWFMYLLEETKEDMMARVMCHLIYHLSGKKTEVSPTELMSSDNTPVSQEALDIMESEEFNSIIDFFESHTEFSSSLNPTGVYNECLSYAKEHGKIHTRKKRYKDDMGIEHEVDGFDWYEPDDEDEYRIVIVDHVSLLSQERGFTLKQTIDKLGEYCIILRDKYRFTPVLIQQQNTDQESNDAFKLQRLRPTVAGLADSKYTARNCSVFLGLFSPVKFELNNYKGYNIELFRDNIRFLEVVLNRGGSQGGMVALYFNGKVCDFVELPKPDDRVEMDKWYSWLRSRGRNVKSFFIYGIRKKERELCNPGFFTRFTALFRLKKVRRTKETDKTEENG